MSNVPSPAPFEAAEFAVAAHAPPGEFQFEHLTCSTFAAENHMLSTTRTRTKYLTEKGKDYPTLFLSCNVSHPAVFCTDYLVCPPGQELFNLLALVSGL